MEQPLRVLLYGMQYRKLLDHEVSTLEERYELCKIDILILMFLYQSEEHNTSKDITDMNLFTKGHISQSLSRLAKKRLVTVAHDTSDKRCYHIFLTNAAKKIVREAQEVYEKIEAIVFEGLDDDARQRLIRTADTINRNIARAMTE